MVQMSKITAVLDQETWISVDPPDEFQAIVDMFAQEQVVDNGSLGSEETSEIECTLTSETPVSNISNAVMTGSPEAIAGIKRHNSAPSEVMEKQKNSGDAEKFGSLQTASPGDPNSFQPSHKDVDVVMTNGVESKTVKSSSTLQKEDVIIASVSSKSKKSKDKLTIKTLDFRGMKFHTVNR